MDEPKQSAARASGFVIPIALGILLTAYVWPQDFGDVTYTRLLGEQVDGAPRNVRAAGATAVMHLQWLVVALAVFRKVDARRRAFVLGAAALLGVVELLYATAFAVFVEFAGFTTWLSGTGGLFLVVGALGAMDRYGAPEIRDGEGARA